MRNFFIPGILALEYSTLDCGGEFDRVTGTELNPDKLCSFLP